MVSTKISKGSL